MNQWMRNALTLPSPHVSWSSQHSQVCFYTCVLPDPSEKDRKDFDVWMSEGCNLIRFCWEGRKELLEPPTYNVQHTCILVLMTSRGVFPNTLAAPAIAPKVPVSKGLIALLGLSPNGGRRVIAGDQMTEGGGETSSSRRDFTLTFVPVLQGGHHIEADGLVGALLQDGGGETLVRPSQSWGQPRHGGGVWV